MMSIEKTFIINTDDSQEINYFQQLRCSRDQNLFMIPWGGCLLKNCNDAGDLLDFKNLKEYEDFMKVEKRTLWLHMRFKAFRTPTTSAIYGVFVCPQCNITSSLLGLEATQLPENVANRMCRHSLVVSMLSNDWRTYWSVNADIGDELLDIDISVEGSELVKTFAYSDSDNLLLAAVTDSSRNVSILYCATLRQDVPFCSSCVRRKCPHYKRLLNSHSEENSGRLNTCIEEADDDNSYDLQSEVDQEGQSFDDHYLIPLPRHEHSKRYGYNFLPVIYPFFDSPEQQLGWLERINGHVNLPEKLIPPFDGDLKCKHGSCYSSSELTLKIVSESVCIYNEIGEKIVGTKVYARPTISSCACLHRVDGHSFLLWNLGNGRFVDYTLLLGYVHKWRTSGMPMFAYFKSISDCAKSCGVSSTLTYKDIQRSICGFFANLKFDDQKAFSCPTHGTSPQWIVADGKNVGPLKRRVSHLKELDVAEDDDAILEQSTQYSDRVFLCDIKERKLLLKLLTGDICVEDFVNSEELTSINGGMVRRLVIHIESLYPGALPREYRDFLKNIGRNSSARSLLQVNDTALLNDLAKFCRGILDVRQLKFQFILDTFKRALPVLWSILDNICLLERKKYLPIEVSTIVLKFINMRQSMFDKAAVRTNDQYHRWRDSDSEHATQCYPSLPLIRHPSRYCVRNKKDADLCDKAFGYNSDFVAGFFSVGCACENATTFGFEIMLLKESPRNLFRFLMTRDVDFNALKGILIDHACILDSYIMNREATLLEDKILLVDG